MADDISVVVKVVGNKEIVSTTNNLKKMETGVKKLAQDLTKGRITGEQYNKGLKELRQTVDKSFSSWQQAKAAVDKYSKELKALTETQKQAKAAAQAEAAATKAYAQARREATEANRRFDAEAKKAAATARQQALANRKLRMEYREGYAAKVQLRLEQMRLSAAMRKGIIDTDQYKLAMDRLGQTAGRSGRSMNRTGVIVQQSGYQIGDFLVQVQSGTNAMVAFGQQATQVAGTLTILGGKWVGIGTALGVTIPLLTAVGAYFMRTAKSADETSKSVENLEDSLKSLDSALQDWVRTKKAASMGLTVDELLGTESLEDATENLREARLELERISTAAALAGKGAAGGIDIFSLLGMGEQAQLDAAVQKVVDAENRLATLRQRDSDKRLSNFQEEYQAQMDNLELQRTIAQFGSDSRQTRALELEQEIESYNRQIDLQVQQNDLTVAHGVALKKAFEEATRLEATIEDGKIMSEKLADGFDAAKVKLGELSAEALTLRDRLVSAAGAAYAIAQQAMEDVQYSESVGRGRGPNPGATVEGILANNMAAHMASLEIPNRPETKTGGGAGGAVGNEAKLQAFISSLETEREALNSWYGEQQNLLAQFNESELEAIGGQAEAKLRIEREYSDRLVKLKQNESSLVKSSARGMYNDLAGLLNMFAGKSKAAAIASIALTKGLRIAEVIASGAAAQVRALAELGPILGPPAAAKIAGFTKLQAGIIAATGLTQAASLGGGGSSISSGSGSTPSGADAAVPAQEAPQAQRVLIKGIGPKDLLTGEMLQELFDKLYDENQERGAVFMVST